MKNFLIFFFNFFISDGIFAPKIITKNLSQVLTLWLYMKKVCDMYTLGVPVYTKRTVCCNTPCIWMKVWNLLHGYCIFADFDLYQIQSLRKSFKVRFLKKILEKPISPKKLPPIFSKQIGFKISSRYDPNPNSTTVAERGRAVAGGRWTAATAHFMC